MSTSTSTHIEQQIINVIKRFKFEELQSSIMPIFPEISWTNVKSQLIKNHKTFTSINVAQLIKKIITEVNLSEKALINRLLTLKLLDISWHNKRVMWYGYTFISANKSVNYFINGDIVDNMQNYFCSLNLKIDVRVHAHSGITYVALFKRGKNVGKQKYISAVCFALFTGQKYFFSTKRHVSSDLLNALISSLGYMDSKRLKLMGRDLRSLSKLYWKRMEGTLNCNIDNTLEYKDAAPDIKKTGIDFTQQQQRKKYSETCFGDNPATIEMLVLHAPSTPLSHKDIIKELPNENICTTWEFHSHNITECLTKLIERRVLVTPVPSYISNLMVLGKNELTLKYNN